MPERPVSAFSRSFALHLRGVMAERNIQQNDVAERMGRSKAYVSEHTSGRRPVDSDLLDAVAEVAGIDSAELIGEIARRMSTSIPPRVGPRPDPAEVFDEVMGEKLDRGGEGSTLSSEDATA